MVLYLDMMNQIRCILSGVITILVKAWILKVVSKQIYASILYFQDAHAIWKDLANRFLKSNTSLIYKLETEIVLLKQGSIDLASYYTAKVTL